MYLRNFGFPWFTRWFLFLGSNNVAYGDSTGELWLTFPFASGAVSQEDPLGFVLLPDFGYLCGAIMVFFLSSIFVAWRITVFTDSGTVRMNANCGQFDSQNGINDSVRRILWVNWLWNGYCTCFLIFLNFGLPSGGLHVLLFSDGSRHYTER